MPGRPRKTKNPLKMKNRKPFFIAKKVQLQMDANAKPFAVNFTNSKTSRSVLKVML